MILTPIPRDKLAHTQCEHDQCSSTVIPETKRRGPRLVDPRTVLLRATEPEPQWTNGTLGGGRQQRVGQALFGRVACRQDRRVSRGGFPSARRRARGSQRHSSFSARARPPRSRRRGSRPPEICHRVPCLPVDLPRRTDMLAGATMHAPVALPRWVKELPRGRPIGVYFICGFQVNGRAVPDLRQPGYDARALVGGITAWHAIGGTTVPLDISTYEEAP